MDDMRTGANADDTVPPSIRIAAAWAWRVAVIVLVGAGVLWALSYVKLIVIPLLVATLIAGLLHPLVSWLTRRKVPKGLAVAVCLGGLILLVLAALTLVGGQLVSGFRDLWDQALAGFVQFQQWLATGPFNVSGRQLDQAAGQIASLLHNQSSSLLSGALSVGTGAAHFAAGLLLTLFSALFFLLDGGNIWRWLLSLFPARARFALDGAGRRGWLTLVGYVRVQLFVAFIDAVGIGVVAAILQVPLAFPLAILVFLGSFIPIVGALVTGVVAVLIALVANGWVNAVIMLAGVLVVQQVESHVLQPLVMGKAVSVHPLTVVLAVAAGSFVAGIAGALFAVPVVAVLNTIVRYLAQRQWEHADSSRSLPVPSPPEALGETSELDEREEES